MPCHDGGPSDDVYTRLDRVTRLLCAVLTDMEPVDRNEALASSTDLADWWAEHEIHDRRRQREEVRRADEQRLRAGALAKLTAVERQSLGLP